MSVFALLLKILGKLNDILASQAEIKTQLDRIESEIVGNQAVSLTTVVGTPQEQK